MQKDAHPREYHKLLPSNQCHMPKDMTVHIASLQTAMSEFHQIKKSLTLTQLQLPAQDE